jgi:transcription initiation factor TFIIB
MDGQDFTNTSCPNCESKDIILEYSVGDVVCRECGIVVGSRMMDSSNETHNYNDDSAVASRTSGVAESAGYLHTYFVSNSSSLQRSLEKAQLMSSDKKECKLIKKLPLVKETCSKMNLPNNITVSFLNFYSCF